MPEKTNNSNWTEGKDGWHRTGNAKGNASYFERPAPPVRDAATGYPIGSDGKIDWAAVIREVNQRDGNG